MLRFFCKSKIGNAVITGKELHYNGSIGIDKNIMEASDIMPGEQVDVLNINNGNRFTTYAIEEEIGTGKIVLYGPAVRQGEVGDEVVILSYCMLEPKETHNYDMRAIQLGKNNALKK